MSLLFVYGSLKEGFPNFHVNRGRRIGGAFVTAEKHEFWLFKGRLPCLLPATGAGHHVLGQLFEVTAADLAAMDELERVGQPGGYRRIEIEVKARDQATPERIRTFVYVQDPALLSQPGEHVGPITKYTREHARSLRW